MARIWGLEIAVVLIVSLAGCSLESSTNTSQRALASAKALFGADQIEKLNSLDGKQRQIAALQAQLSSIDRSKLSPELRSSVSNVERQLSGEGDRLQQLLYSDVDDPKTGDVGSFFDDTARKNVSQEPSTEGAFGSGTLEVVIRGETHLRGAPSRNSISITIVERGTEALLKKVDGDWIHVRLSNPRIEGYVFGDFVAPKDPQSPDGEPSDLINADSSQFSSLNAIEPATNGDSTQNGAPLTQSVDNFSDVIEKERVAFKSPAFQCRGELEICRRGGLGYLDCDLTMLVCLADLLVGD